MMRDNEIKQQDVSTFKSVVKYVLNITLKRFCAFQSPCQVGTQGRVV